MKKLIFFVSLIAFTLSISAQYERREGGVEYKKRRANGKIVLTPGANSDIVLNDSMTIRYNSGEIKFLKLGVEKFAFTASGMNTDIIFNDSTTLRYADDELKVLINGTTRIRVGATTTTVPGITLGSTAITSTGIELNYTDGVTSAIQTQIDAKPTIVTVAGDTTGTTPAKIGNIFIDTTNSKVYVSKTAARGGWMILNFIMLISIYKRRKK